MIMLVQS